MYDFYGIYTSCRDSAWRCLLDFDIVSLPVKLISATKRAGIRVVKNSEVGELRRGEAGASIYCNKMWIIIYDDRLSDTEARMVIAHELGHILLGHNYKYSEMRFASDSKKLKSEQEADMFAVRLLAPACVLHELRVTDTDGIANLCQIPHAVAADRARRMQILEKRGVYYTNPLECSVHEKFSDFIKEKSFIQNIQSSE